MRSILLVCAVAAAARSQLVATSSAERWQRTRGLHATRHKLVQERRLLRWAEWPRVVASRPELPETRDEFLKNKEDDLVRVILSYALIVFCLHTRIGFIGGSLIDKIHRQLGRCAAIALYGTCFKSAALRLLNVAIHREDFQTIRPDILSSLMFLASALLASYNMGGISAFFFSMSDFIAKSLAAPFDVQMTCVGVLWLFAKVVFEGRRFRPERVRLWIKSTARVVVESIVEVLIPLGVVMGMSMGMLMGGHILGDASRAASHSAMTTQLALQAFAGVVMMLGSMVAYHLIVMRPILRRLPPRPEFWPAWMERDLGC